VRGKRAKDEEWTVYARRQSGPGRGWGHPRDYSDFKGLVFGICRRHKRTATLNWMSFGFIDFTIAATVTADPRVLFTTLSLSLSFSLYHVLHRVPNTNINIHIYIYIILSALPRRSLSVRPSVRPYLSCCSVARATSGRPSTVAVKFPKVRRGTLSFT